MMGEADPLTSILGEVVDRHFKGFPTVDAPPTIGTVRDAGWSVLGGDLLLPILVLKDDALEHNLRLMARLCTDRGVSLAPHAKTAMAPQLVRRQLDAGAWGITVATVAQARVFRSFGVRRILIANELTDPAGLRWLAREATDPESDVFVLVDSTRGVELLSEACAGAGRPIPVLVELGVPGGRAGCRTIEDALEVAAAVRRSPSLALAGVEAFEGVIDAGGLDSTLAAVDAFLEDLARLTRELDRAGAFAARGEVIVSAGGSAYFDRVIEVLRPSVEPILGDRLRLVLRSGCYLTHDVGFYERRSPLGGTRGSPDPELRLRNAIELWGSVLSRPEPDLAIVGFGRRDVGFDHGPPIPLFVKDDALREVAGSMEVVSLNDQHAFVRVPGSDPLAPGDVMGCGISHPCTTLDRWSAIPVVDEDYQVIDAIRTFF